MNADEAYALYSSHPELFSDSSGHSGAKTLFFTGGDAFYLKIAERGTLRPEYERLAWFSRRVAASVPLDYASGRLDLLMTRPLCGAPATDPAFLAEPERLARTLGRALRGFHDSLSPADCPFSNSSAALAARAERGYESGKFDAALAAYSALESAAEAHEFLRVHACELRDDVVTHGDYCLPNVLLRPDMSPAGFLDLGSAGAGDRHYDLFWGCWSLRYNLGTAAYSDTFLDAYGRDAVSPARLRCVACALALE